MASVVEFLAGVVSSLALIILILAHGVAAAVLLFANVLLYGRMAEKFVTWINSRRLRLDCSPHESRGWTK